MRLIVVVVFLIFSLPFAVLEAAACCSGGSAIPNLMVGDDRFHLSAAFDAGFVVGEVDQNGESVFYDEAMNERLMGVNLGGALRLHPQWQVGLKLPFRMRHFESQSRQDLGDIKAHLVFEPFPLYSYSPWRPKLFVFGAMTFPTGRSSYETQQVRLDSFGRGFYAPSLGFLLSKEWRRFDVFASGEWIYQIRRRFTAESVDPGSLFSAGVGGGYRLGSWRLGASVGPNYEQTKQFERANRKGPSKLVWDATAELSYNWSEHMSTSLAYLDQSLVGPARNVDMVRSFSLSFLYRSPL